MKPKWQQKIGVRLTRHVIGTTAAGTLAAFKINLKHQRDTGTVCWECRKIAEKLNIKEAS